jgi:hypothetical protein
MAQTPYADGPINGRMLADTSPAPPPDSLVPFYQVRAALAIVAFCARFGTGPYN